MTDERLALVTTDLGSRLPATFVYGKRSKKFVDEKRVGKKR